MCGHMGKKSPIKMKTLEHAPQIGIMFQCVLLLRVVKLKPKNENADPSRTTGNSRALAKTNAVFS